MSHVLTLLITVLAVSACNRTTASEPGCAGVADKVIEIIEAGAGQLSADEKKALSAQLATIRSELVNECENDPEFFESKSPCIMKASSKADLEACEKSP